MIVEAFGEFAAEMLRPAAADADAACVDPGGAARPERRDRARRSSASPRSSAASSTERSAVTGVLVAEALAKGDMGLAVADPRAGGRRHRASPVGRRASSRRPTCRPSPATTSRPPRSRSPSRAPLFDPLELGDHGDRATDDGFVLDGVKSLVPRGADAELFVVGAELDGAARRCSSSSPSTDGMLDRGRARDGPARRRAAPARARRRRGPGATRCSATPTADVRRVRAARRGSPGARSRVGTGQAVLDYVIPYVNEREAFGEPISHRQSVAFMVANIAIELQACGC